MDKAQLPARQNIKPIVGESIDERLLFQAAQSADAVINAADADNPFVVETLLQALAGSGKKLIHTSGSSIIGDRAAGESRRLVKPCYPIRSQAPKLLTKPVSASKDSGLVERSLVSLPGRLSRNANIAGVRNAFARAATPIIRSSGVGKRRI